MIELPSGTIEGPYETRGEWLRARRTGLGGSDIGAILGLSTYTSGLEVYYSKLEDAPEREPNEAMEIGRDIESWILHRWGTDAVDFIYDDLTTIRCNTFPFLLHSPDGLLVLRHDMDDPKPKTALAGIEVKNIRSDQSWDPLPPVYMAQVQHGLLCSGLDRWIVVALVAGQKLITREIEPDREMQGRIAVEGEKFWTAHVLRNVPPDPDGSENAGKALQRQWSDSAPVSVDVDPVLWAEYRDWVESVKISERRRDELAQLVQAQMGEAEVAKVDGEKVATWKTSTRTTLDIKRLKSEQPALAKKYQVVTPTRSFRSVSRGSQ